MFNQRTTDCETSTQFRSSRFFQDGGKWFFYTREGTVEGPFGFRYEAEERLEVYKKVMASGFMPPDSTLAIQPLVTPRHPLG